MFPTGIASTAGPLLLLRLGCHSWPRHRSSATSLQSVVVEKEKEKDNTQAAAVKNLRRKIPWLLVSSPEKPESRFLYDFTQEEEEEEENNNNKKMISHEIHLPQLSFHYLIGSSQGFLFSLNQVSEIHATNPLTGAHLPIPPTASLPGVVGVFRSCFEDSFSAEARPMSPGKITHYAVYVNKWSNPPELDYFSAGDRMRYQYFTKAILSPSLDTAVVIHGPGKLAFSRLGVGGPQSSSWTALPAPIHLSQDVLFHKGCLHAIDSCGTLAIFGADLDPLAPPILSPTAPLGALSKIFRRSLVESPDGEDLFLVFRGFYTPEEWDKITRIQGRNCRESWAWEDEENPPRTKSFKVYKLDHSNYRWKPVESIGDLAFFLGYNHSFALSARDSPGLQPNSIYFTDHFQGRYEPELVGDSGVCNLEDRSVNFYPLCFDGRQDQEFNWPLPIWYMPSIGC